MTSVTAAQIASPPDTTVHLDDVSWETYRELRESPANNGVRMTYDQGALVLMSPSKRHERVSELLGQFIVEWLVARGIEFQSCGAVTFQRDDLAKGTEPDKCFYVQHEAAVRARDELNLAADPPPDLAIEVDVTALSDRKLTIYAAVGVPEVWRWKEETVQLMQLQDGRYLEVDESTVLPGFPLGEAVRLIQSRHERDNMTLLREFRKLVESN